MIKKNMGKIDQLIRLLVGLTLIYIGFIETTIVSDSVLRWLLGLIGVVNFASALVATCPLYHLIHFSTCENKKVDE